jgi:plasmid stabilization system protein ParE
LNFSVHIRLAAKLDIAQAEDWYEDRTPGLGVRFRTRVYDAIERIGRNPFGYPEMLPGIRRLVMSGFPFNIWFRVIGEEVLIVAVIHGKRGSRFVSAKLRGV